MMLSLCSGISFTPPFPGKQGHGVLHCKKKCVREMRVEVGSFSGCPGCYLGNIRVFPTIEVMQFAPFYKARHAHKHLYTVLAQYSKIQVLPSITSYRLMKYSKQAIELNSLLINNMPKDGYG